MKLASFTMYRNEAALLGPFLDQLHALFDHSMLIDHESSDESPALVAARAGEHWQQLRLVSADYPQAELATYAMRRVFTETDADWLFFLDCDEFLPFASRELLQGRLGEIARSNYRLSHIRWRNLLPERLDGTDIFAGRFQSRPDLNRFGKVIVSRALYEARPELTIAQGYHDVAMATGEPVAELSEAGLLHIPVPSRMRFVAKIVQGGRLMIENQELFAKNAGRHWANMYLELEAQGVERFDFERAALDYPRTELGSSDQRVELDFGFDYVVTPYAEPLSDTVNQLIRTRTPRPRPTALMEGTDIVIDFTAADRPMAAESAALHHDAAMSDWSSLLVPLLEPIATSDDGDAVVESLLSVVVAASRPRATLVVTDEPAEMVRVLALAAERLDLATRLYVVPYIDDSSSAARLTACETQMYGVVTNVEFGVAGRELSAGSVDLLVIDPRPGDADLGQRALLADLSRQLAPACVIVVVGPSGVGAEVCDVLGGTPERRFYAVGRGVTVGVANGRADGLLAVMLRAGGVGDRYGRLVELVAESGAERSEKSMTDEEVQRLAALEYELDDLKMQISAARGDLRSAAFEHAGLLERVARLEATSRSGR